jgi:hypothetical protein
VDIGGQAGRGVPHGRLQVAEKIGEYLVRIGAITREQVARVLQLQAAGDKRMFGAIAEDLKYITSYDRIRDFLAALKK